MDRGYDAWLDHNRLEGGSNWSREIETALDNSDIVLALLSKGSYESDVCRGEQLRSLRHGTCLIPLLVHSDADRPVYLEARQYSDFSDLSVYDKQLQAIIRNIEDRVGAALATGFQQTRYDTVPPLPANFVPRPADLDELRRIVLGDQDLRNVALVALRGMGGIGKTVLAQALCGDETVQAAFHDGIVWVSLGQKPSEADLLNQIRHAARALGKTTEGFDTLQESSKLLRTFLKDKAVLLVLDDVWQVNHVYYFQPADARQCRLVFTTRNAEISAATGAKSYRLDVLADEESCLLLARYADWNQEDLPAEATTIVEECQGLPLALAMIGAMLREEPQQRWSDVADSLRKADWEEISLEFPNYAYPSVIAAMDVGVRDLELQLQRCYLNLAIIPEDAVIPESALEIIWEMEPKAARRVVSKLARRSLATWHEQGGLSLHDVQLDYVRKRAHNLTRCHRGLLNRYRDKCPNGWDTGPNDGYFFKYLTYHLRESRQEEQLKRLLLDLRWIKKKLWITDVTALIDDFNVALNLTGAMVSSKGLDSELSGQPIRIPPWSKTDSSVGSICAKRSGKHETHSSALHLLQAGLRLSAHVLAEDKTQLCSQLCGRLPLRVPEIRKLRSQLEGSQEWAWIRPLCSTLTPPGGSLVRTLKGHTKSINGIAVTPDGKLAISASDDKTLKVWSLETGQELRTLTGHTSWVNAVAVTPDGKYAVSASSDETLMVWDLSTGSRLRTLVGHASSVRTVAITPDGNHVVSGSADETLMLWNLHTGDWICTLIGHSGPIKAVVITADGKHAISASEDKTLNVWDLARGKKIRTLVGHTDSVDAVALVPSGTECISGSNDATLKVWSFLSRKKARTLTSNTQWAWAVAVTPDSQQVVYSSGYAKLEVRNIMTSELTGSLIGHRDWVHMVAITPDGKHGISASGDETLKVWDLTARSLEPAKTGHSRAVNAVAVTPNGKTGISASADNTLQVWDLKAYRVKAKLTGHRGWVTAAVVTPDNRWVVSGSYDQTIRVWHLASGRNERTLVGHTKEVNALALTGDGQHCVSASTDRTLKVWNLTTGQIIWTLVGHTDSANAVAVTPNGKCVISGSDDETLRVWDLSSGRELRILSGHTSWIHAVATMPDSDYVVSGSGDGTIKIWNLQTGRNVRTLRGHTEWVSSITVMPNGKQIISTSGDATLKIWDVETGTAISFTADANLACCAVAKDERTIMAGDDSGTVHFLSLESKAPKSTIK